LETIALGYSEGIVSVDILIKACNHYKLQENLVGNFEYDKKVSKSLFDQLNGVKPNKELLKAIVPGQTKYVDGVLYIYSATKQGSKTDYGWHVAQKSKVGKGSTLDDKAAKAAESAVNELFPVDIASVTEVKRLGGSTGAKLVKDVKGNEYVMKRVDKSINPKGNAEHIRSEYVANMLYNILGQRTPDYELYDADTDDPKLLSRFIPGTRQPNSRDFAKMSEGFIADILLANWDVYMNDNCLIDAGGNVIRVDNGGCLAFRAKGELKSPPFDGDVNRTYRDMLNYNSLLAKYLVDENVVQQIDNALAKRDDIVNFLKESGDDNLANIFGQRIDGLKTIRDQINANIARKAALAAAKAGKIPPRKLMPKQEMYRALEDDELEDVFNEVAQMCGGQKDRALTNTDSTFGWSILSRICQLRGFDARPKVVTEADFWKEAAKADLPLMLRGNASGGGKTAGEYADMFRYDDVCFYGKAGIWGQGIYAHTDDKNDKWIRYQSKADDYDRKDDVNLHSTQTNYKSTQGYIDAFSYAGSSDEGVLKILWEKGANVVNIEDLINEIKATPPQLKDKKLFATIQSLQKQLNTVKSEWTNAKLALQNISKTIQDTVRKKMHYDEDAIAEMYDTIDNTDWGNRNAQGKFDYPSYDDFVVGKMVEWVTKNGGKAKIDKDFVVFEINGQRESIARESWENNAIRRKSAITSPYHYQAELFKTFMETNCIGKVQKAIDFALRHSTDATAKAQAEADTKEKEYYKIDADLKQAMQNSVSDSLYSYIYSKVKGLGLRDSGDNMSVVGIYAAMKGYDGIYIHNGNDWNHGFNVILNRSKVITSME